MKNKLLLILILVTILFQLPVANAQKVVKDKKSVAPIFKDKEIVYFKFKIKDKKEIETITHVVSIDNVKGNDVYAYATIAQFAKFLTYNYQYELIADDNNSNADNFQFTPVNKATTTWNFYPTYIAYDTIMTAFQTNYPNICRTINLKTLTSGRKLLFCKISKNPDVKENEPRVLYTSSIHGNELTGYILMLHLIDYLLSNYGIDQRITNMIDSTEIWINPLANPDGTYKGGNSSVGGAIRNNNNNVDLNRNYPDFNFGAHPDNLPYQQETMAFMGLADSVEFTSSINFHGGSQVCNYPWDSKYALNPDDTWWQYVCRQYADTVHIYSGSTYLADLMNGITNGALWYVISGGRQDYMNYYHHCREFTLEISTTKLPPGASLPSYWNYNYRSLLNYIDEARYGIRGVVTDSVTGLPLRAKVFIKGHDADSTEVNTYMPNGNYHRPIYAGNYNVTYYAPGHCTKTINVTSVNKQSFTQNVSLSPLKINGPSNVSQGQNNINYSVYPAPDSASYSWILPANYSGTSTTNTISINASSTAQAGELKVRIVNKLGYVDTVKLNLHLTKKLVVKTFIEGLYDVSTAKMNKVQDENGDHYGADTADVISICLAQAISPYQFTDTLYSAINTAGIVVASIPTTVTDSVYLVIRHRNSLETWSAIPVIFNSDSIYYDFTNAIGKSYGATTKLVAPNVYAIYSGDIIQDGIVNIFDLSSVFDCINDPLGGSGYILNDLNADTVANIFDLSIVFDNLNSGAATLNPITGY